MCPVARGTKKWWRSYLTTPTIELINRRACAHRSLIHANGLLRFYCTSAAWHLWKIACRQSSGDQCQWLMCTNEGNLLGNTRRWLTEAAWYGMDFARLAFSVVRAVRGDRAALLRDKVRILETAAVEGICPPLYDAVSWFAGRPRATNAALANQFGEPAADAEEAARNAHDLLARLTGGTTQELEAHIERQRDVSSAEASFLEEVARDVGGMVPLTLLTTQMAKAKRGKAMGPSLQLPEMYRSVPIQMASLFDPLVQKMCLSLTSAVQMGAARIAFIPKSATGPKQLQSNRRAVWLADQLPKCLGAALRPRVSAFVQKSVMGGQHGMGWGVGGVDATHLVLGGFASTAAHYRQSSAMVFVDIKAAYDSTTASMALPHVDGHGHVTRVVIEMGFSEEEAEEIACETSRLREWGRAPTHLAHTMAMLARDSWGKVDGSDEATIPSHGVAPGIPLADVTFGIVASRIARRVRQKLAENNLQTSFDSERAAALLGLQLPEEFAGRILVEDVSYVDDSVYLVSARAEDLVDKVARTMAVVDSVYAQHGFVLGLRPDKSAVVLNFAGEGAQAEARKMLA